MFAARFLKESPRRRGLTIFFTAVVMITLISFAALTIDVGQLFIVRADLQNAADAAALAGVSAFATEEMVKIKTAALSGESSGSIADIVAGAIQRSRQLSAKNNSFGSNRTILESEDITVGHLDATNPNATMDTNPLPQDYNAVGVTVRRQEEGPNGPVKFFFAPIFGKHSSNVSASAVAVFDDRYTGYRPDIPYSADVWPFSIHKDEWDKWLLTGPDYFEYDNGSGTVDRGTDGLTEVNLYPKRTAPGNFGSLNIGRGEQGSTELINQIENGVSGENLDAEIGTDTLSFHDENGNPTTYTIIGQTGLKAGLEDNIETRIGDVVAFFLHDQVTEQGATAIYRVTQIRFGRVMHVQLGGGGALEGLWVQPVSYTGPGIVVGPGSVSSDGVMGRIILAR